MPSVRVGLGQIELWTLVSACLCVCVFVCKVFFKVCVVCLGLKWVCRIGSLWGVRIGS